MKCGVWRAGARREGLAGWFSLGSSDHAVGLAARWFWQQYPQSVDADAAANHVQPVGARGRTRRGGHGCRQDARDGVLGRRRAALGTHHRRRGRWWRWSMARGSPTPARCRRPWRPIHIRTVFCKAFARRSIATCNATRSNAGTIAERCNARELLGERPRTGAYGMWNWGDWNFPKYHDQTKGCDAWGNLEYDTTQVLALGFAATGDVQMSDAMVAAARHFMDVDTIHFQRRHPDWVGMNHPKNPLHFSFELGGVDLGHTWTEGLLSYYYLTGDERGLAGARTIADYLVQRSRGILALANPRQLGWPQIALLAVYDATGETAYLDAARVYAKRALELFKPDEITHWKHGILADAFAYMHAATHDATLEHWLRTYAHTVSQRPRAEPRFIPGVAYVARLTHDAHLRTFASAGVQTDRPGRLGQTVHAPAALGFGSTRCWRNRRPWVRDKRSTSIPRLGDPQ